MDKITKAHYRFVRQNLESKDKDTQASVRRILKERGILISKSKMKHFSASIAMHYTSKINGIDFALSELGIDIKRYGG